MIQLRNENTKQTFKVKSEVQAKPFIRAGYVVVTEGNQKSTTSGRGKKSDSEEK